MSSAATARGSLAGATILQLVPALRDDPAEFMFSPQSVAEAIRGVYTSLLARDA